MLDFHVSYLLIYIVTSDCLDDMTSICVFINATEYYHLFTLFLEVVLYLYCSFPKINPAVGGGWGWNLFSISPTINFFYKNRNRSL